MKDDARVRPHDEEQSRCDCYKLISRLFYGAPDAALLAGIAESPTHGLDHHPTGNAYVRTFRELQEMARIADAEALRQAYDDLFVGAGKAPVTTYISGYAVPHAPDRHLLELREWMAIRGLQRREGVYETEDHVSAVCDVMRWLIEHDCALQAQREFFDRFVHAGAVGFFTAIQTASSRSFYCAVASLAQAFFAVEKEAFDLHEA
jgi:TorA maturation chaperone TorD